MPSGWVKYGRFTRLQRYQVQAEMAYWNAITLHEQIPEQAFKDTEVAKQMLALAAAHHWIYQLTVRELLSLDKT